METLTDIFGTGKELNALQMSCRGITIFIITLVLIRISGRRSFGIRTPLDNIIVILLGALLSRAIVGASPFVPIITVSLVIVLLHRIFGWLTVHSKIMQHLLEGRKIVLYEQGQFQKQNMEKALVCEEDVMQGIRKAALTEDPSKIREVYMERNGEISVVKKGVDH